MNSDSNNKKRKNWIIGIISAMVLIVILMFLAVNFIAEPYLKNKLVSEFESASNSDAILELSDLDIGVIPLSVSIEGVTLSKGPDAEARLDGHPVYESNIASISMSGISLWRFIISGDLEVGELLVDGADLHASPGLINRFKSSSDKDSGSSQSKAIIFNSLVINNSSIKLYEDDLSSVKSSVYGMNMQASGINLSSGELESSERFDRLSFNVDSLKHTTQSGYYSFNVSGMSFTSEPGNLVALNFQVIPQYSALELPRQIGHETDHIDIQSGVITLNGLNVKEIVSNNLLSANRLKIERPIVKISRDKTPPDKPKNPKPLFNTTFASLPIAISLDTLSVEDGFISYREWKEQQDSSGTVFFDSVQIQMTNIQNVNHGAKILAEASSMFMNESELNVNFEFSLANNGSQTISGTLDRIDLQTLNPVLAPLAFVQIDRGLVHSLSFDFALNETASNGQFHALYENFSMSMLSKKDLEKSTGNRILSFLANNIQIHSSNTEPDPRVGEISFEREIGQSTVNYWWKSLSSGIKDLVTRM